MRALVLGGAKTLFEDEDRARAMGFEPDIIVATNHAGRDRPGPVDHWCSFHAELFPMWLAARREAGLPDPGKLWVAERTLVAPPKLGVPIEKAPHWGGSSGLLAVTVALLLGAEKIVLAGVPLLPSGEHYDRPGRWADAGNYRRAWMARVPIMRDRVRSMCGWTAELLGEPDAEWLATRSRAE